MSYNPQYQPNYYAPPQPVFQPVPQYQQPYAPPPPQGYAPPPPQGYAPPHGYAPPPPQGYAPPVPAAGYGVMPVSAPQHALPSQFAAPHQQAAATPVQVNHFQQPQFMPGAPASAPRAAPEMFSAGSAIPKLATTTTHPLSFVEASMRKTAKIPDKSLLFCLTLDNPFHMGDGDFRFVPERTLDGSWETRHDGTRLKLPFPFLGDDELLMPPPKGDEKGAATGGPSPFTAIAPHFQQLQDGMSSLAQGLMSFSNGGRGDGTAPNKFQKVIEMILRMYHRGIDVYPNDMIAPVQDCATAEGTSQNYFHKYTLVEENLMVSPDYDEMYIRIYVGRDVMMTFAEEQGVLLPTNPYSFAGGAPVSYSKSMDAQLKQSVQLFMDAFPNDCKGDVDDQADGFVLDVPDKMRIVTRMMRESWQFGGCGLQLDEMKRNGVLIRHFFPLHNIHYQKAYQLDEWASLKAMFSMDPLQQNDNAIRKYFGEEVALYFGWLVTYTKFLRYIAAAGVAFGILSSVAQSSDVIKDDVAPISNAIFSIFCVVWGITWNFRSIRYENYFATRFGQEAQITQELVRDEFQKDSEKVVTVEELFRLKFDVPLTIKVRADGSLVDLQYSHRKRLLRRFLIAYPCVIALTVGMVALQLLITKWRLSDCSTVTSTLCSICSVVVSVSFGIVFDRIVPILNGLENNRTDTEEAFQTISKSFFFYFFSNFFALFSIALYPSNQDFVCVGDVQYSYTNGTYVPPLPANTPGLDASGGTDRLDEIMFQMVFTTVVKPMIQNIMELMMPFAKAKLRVYMDTKNLAKGAAHRAVRPNQGEANVLWEESQLEPYESTSGDYLEITLQFGFMTMFAAAFPLATVAALAYNIFEVRLDAIKLLQFSQRPVARPAAGIGAWRGIQFFISALSVVSNGYMVAVLSNFSETIKVGDDSGTKYKVFVVAQYIVMMMFYIVYTTYAGLSPKSEKLRVKHALVSNQASREKLLDDLTRLQRTKSGTGLMHQELDAMQATAPPAVTAISPEALIEEPTLPTRYQSDEDIL